MYSIKDLSVFLCASQCENFTEASIILGTSPSAVGKVIAKIEHEYKTILFKRNTRNLSLTEDGKILLEHAKNIIKELDFAKTKLTEKNKVTIGKIKIGMPNLGRLFDQILIDFIKLHPNIELELHFNDDKVNIIKKNFDIVIRFGQTSDSRLFSKKIGEFEMIQVHSEKYQLQHNDTDNTFLLYIFPSSGKIEEWPIFDYLNFNNIRNKIIFNSINVIMKFCLKGIGIAFLPKFICEDYLKDGKLVEYKSGEKKIRNVSLVWTDNKNKNVRAFIDHFHVNFNN